MTRTNEGEQPVAVITGASQGLGRALAQRLARAGWALVLDARRADRLAEAVASLGTATAVTAVVGDVAEPDHREALRQAATALGRVRLLVNNASTLGASPLPTLGEVPLDVLRRTYEVNAVAPLALFQLFQPTLVDGGTVVNITSDAGAAAYAGWGVYGSSKAALEHWSGVLAEEQPTVRVLVVDPGDMRTEMHQAAFVGEDISDRPPPDASADAIVALIQSDQPSGRYETASLPAEVK
ncbi:MAG: family oxidoreductase [Acidimicrobiia bacterium]|nr:family oxidoreductase [Acidimicrobiia bacterium]